MEHGNRIDGLIAKLAAGTITEEELADLTEWYNRFDDTRVLLSAENDDNAEQLKARMYQRLMKQIRPADRVYRRLSRRWLPYAAAAMLAIAGIWYIADDRINDPAIAQRTAADIVPGGNRATLALADGRTVMLSEEQTGIAVNEALTYLDGTAIIDGQLIAPTYDSEDQLALITPRGGTYQITLPDGTRVWLNSASALSYPSRFDGSERVVELEGEAFFDVSKQQGKPFKVISDGQVVEVLGTQFNISAYPDEPHTKTTLVTGRVQVASTANPGLPIAIAPGQQSNIIGDNIQVTPVDTNQYIAWKQGIFHFESTPLHEMLKQIARWYDVDVTYKRGIPKETFTGKFKRDVSLKGVIDILQLSMIDVTFENGTLMIN
ncbi:FecR family protein [Parapedobacter sp. 10938]|uniref:FecR family protein n=1 Tax=Parapedobacter flavus TaxID=3110225 RepID=UPI002DBE5ACE|nr:FecR domain-containing protein [Parapedobacter sp. 10938]MEC3878110.1 FecR domain-containing protein [Parapedobacter sp. 10938]